MGSYFTYIKSVMMNRYRSLDRAILYSTFIVILFGVFLTLTASPEVAKDVKLSWNHFIIRQTLFLIPAIIMMISVSLLNVKQIRHLAFVGLIGACICVVAVLVFGAEIKGSKRWLNFFGIGLQPSEFIKPCFAVVCAWLLASGRLMNKFPGYPLAVILYAIIAGLLLLQPDVGMWLTVTAIFMVQLFLSGVPLIIFGGLVVLAVCSLPIAYFSFQHVHDRVDRYLSQTIDRTSQVGKSLETLQNAGWFGKGPGEGIVKSDLPDAHTDFIMAVSAEEFGFVLTSVLILIFAFIIIRGFVLIRKENNYFCQIAVAGLLTQVAFQVIVNMGSTLNLLPTKGMTLPFISYGGSSLVSMAITFGFILGLLHSKTLSKGLE